MICILSAPPAISHTILAGAATVVRVLAGSSAPPSPGESVALRSWPATRAAGRVVVVRSAEQRLGKATEVDACAEGWPSWSQFSRHWLYRADYSYREALELATEEDVAERWADRAEVACLLVTVVPDLAERPRLLAARSEHGYVDSPARALRQEPEAVDAGEQARITAAARARDELRLEAAAGETRIALHSEIAYLRERVEAMRSRARRSGVECGAETRTIELSLRRVERRIRGRRD